MCDKCDYGFGKSKPAATPVDSTCQACGSNCDPLTNCDTNGAGKCDFCKSGYALSSAFSCVACSSVTGCNGCTISGTSTVTCTSCANGFTGPNGTGSTSYCVNCNAASTIPSGGPATTGFDANAFSCSVIVSTGAITIVKCKDGYTKFNGKCVSCTSSSSVLGI